MPPEVPIRIAEYWPAAHASLLLNGILIGSAVFAMLTVMTNTQTDIGPRTLHSPRNVKTYVATARA